MDAQDDSGRIAVSICVPLADMRGDAAKHIRSWTQGQRYPRDRFQVIIAASDEHPEAERELAGLLGPDDLLVKRPGLDEIGLYDVAADHARAPWLLITEGHCVGDPDCVGAVLDAIETHPEVDVFGLEIEHEYDTSTQRLQAEWFDELVRRWDAPGGWPRIQKAGTAVRRESYHEANGFDSRFSEVAPHILAARLLDRGARFGTATGARVLHLDLDTMDEHHMHTGMYTRGICEARRELGPAFVERWFGDGGLAPNALAYRRDVARDLARTIVRARLPALAPELVRAGLAAIGGVAPALALARARAALVSAVVELPLPVTRAGLGLLFRVGKRKVQVSQLEWIRADGAGDALLSANGGPVGIDDLPDGIVVHVHGLADHEGRSHRWTQPVFQVRVAAVPEGATLWIDHAGLRGPTHDVVRAIDVDGRPVAAEDRDGRLGIPLPARSGGPYAVTLACAPLHAPGDARRLGLPLFALEVAGPAA